MQLFTTPPVQNLTEDRCAVAPGSLAVAVKHAKLGGVELETYFCFVVAAHWSPLTKKNTTHRPACGTAAAGQGCINCVREEHACKTGKAGLTVGGGKHSGATGGCYGWCGWFWVAAQDLPGNIGAKFFATHRAACGFFNLDAAVSGQDDRAVNPLIYRARRDPEQLCKLDLPVRFKVCFEIHAPNIAGLMRICNSCA